MIVRVIIAATVAAFFVAALQLLRRRALERELRKLESELLSLKERWICPHCKHEQTKDFEWCGKNLKCQGCDTSTYYNEWIVRG